MWRLFVVLALFGTNLFAQAPAGNEKFVEGNYADAIAAYLNVPSAERNAGLLNRLGISYHFLSRFKDAQNAYKAAIRLDPKFAAPANNLAVLYYSQYKFKNAEKQVRKALEIDPQNSTARFNLRASKYARENSRRARDMAKRVAVEDPTLVDKLEGDLLRAVILMPAEDLTSAAEHETRGDTFFARKMYPEAIGEYLKAADVDRYNASILNRLGLVYHQSQKLDEAERYYRKALKLNPYYLEAINNIGTVEYVRKRYNQALKEYSRALKIRPESPTILSNIGACLFAMERYEDGRKVYIYALSIDPTLFDRSSGSGFGTLIQTSQRNGAVLNFNFAKVFAATGDKDRAISALYRAFDEGFKDIEKIKAEPTFAFFADDERFVRLMDLMVAQVQ